MATVLFKHEKRTWQQNLPYTGVTPKHPSVEDCADANGSLNTPDGDDTGLKPVGPYVPPDLCVGTFTISQGDCADTENKLQEENAAAVIAASGAAVNVFKYLGIHEQGKLIDLVGLGKPVGSENVSDVFNSNAPVWESNAKGLEVVKLPTYIGYDFGLKIGSQGSLLHDPYAPEAKMITQIRIKQPVKGNRALQIRVDQSTGDLLVNPNKIVYHEANVGNGVIEGIDPGKGGTVGFVSIFADTPETFSVTFHTSAGEMKVLGRAILNRRFLSNVICFTIKSGDVPFEVDDNFMIPIELNWRRVDVVNLPNIDAPASVQIKQSSPTRYWRIVPVIFQGVTNPAAPWMVDTLELFDQAGPSLDDIQDTVFMENRDRDYARSCIQIKAQYTPFDSVSDLSKFGFQITDIYTFTTTFATMVKALGRPIVIGDVLELPSELQYDHHLKPVRKFLEVTDVGWAADGYTTGWKPIIYKFQAQQLIPGQEHQSLFGNVATQKYGVTDEQMFAGLQQIQTVPLTAAERNAAEATEAVSKTGIDHIEFMSGTNWDGTPGTYDGREYGMEDGLPPDGQEYETGFELPDRMTATDRQFFRLEYDPKLNLPARLYQFSIKKGTWIHIETDRRQIPSSHHRNQRRVFNSIETLSPTSTKF